jgi:hypothetical protein
MVLGNQYWIVYTWTKLNWIARSNPYKLMLNQDIPIHIYSQKGSMCNIGFALYGRFQQLHHIW